MMNSTTMQNEWPLWAMLRASIVGCLIYMYIWLGDMCFRSACRTASTIPPNKSQPLRVGTSTTEHKYIYDFLFFVHVQFMNTFHFRMEKQFVDAHIHIITQHSSSTPKSILCKNGFFSLSLLFASLCDCFLFILCVRVPHVHFMIYNFFNCNCMRCGCSAIEHSAHPPFEAFLNDYFAFCYKTVCVFLSFNTHTQCNVHVHTSSSSCVPFNVYLHSFTILIHLSAFSFVNCNWRFMLVVAMCQSDWCMWKFECVYMLNRWLIIFLSVNIRPRVERFE